MLSVFKYNNNNNIIIKYSHSSQIMKLKSIRSSYILEQFSVDTGISNISIL